MNFKALIDGVHFDPKKGTVKIVLIAASHVSLDELTTVGPKDESILVTLESEQTKIHTFEALPDQPNVGDPITLSEEGDPKPEEAVVDEDYYPEGYAKRKEEEEIKEQERMAGESKAGDPITLEGEEAAAKLKEAAERLKKGDDEGSPEEREAELKEGHIVTEFPLPKGVGGDDDDDDDDDDEVDGGGQGGTI